MAESAWLKGLAPALALASALAMASIASADTVEVLDTGCTTGAQPSFVAGSLITTLKARLGDAMGTAVTCVLMDPSASGDALQFTDTGLAMYRKAGDSAMFTNGDRHWALTGAKLVQWDGGAIRVDAVPPRAQPGTVPIPQSPAPYCGVDLVTDVHARGDASGTLQSDTTQMGVAGKCFDEYFKACAPAIMTTAGPGRDRIASRVFGSADSGPRRRLRLAAAGATARVAAAAANRGCRRSVITADLGEQRRQALTRVPPAVWTVGVVRAPGMGHEPLKDAGALAVAILDERHESR